MQSECLDDEVFVGVKVYVTGIHKYSQGGVNIRLYHQVKMRMPTLSLTAQCIPTKPNGYEVIRLSTVGQNNLPARADIANVRILIFLRE